MTNELKKLVEGMDDSQLAELDAVMKGTRNSRSAVTLESIRPGMKPEERENARAEIARLLREGR